LGLGSVSQVQLAGRSMVLLQRQDTTAETS
jgi:hypothetical protein